MSRRRNSFPNLRIVPPYPGLNLDDDYWKESSKKLFPNGIDLDKMNRRPQIQVDMSGKTSVSPDLVIGGLVVLGKLLFGGDNGNAEEERRRRLAAEKEAAEARQREEEAKRRLAEMTRLGIYPDREVTDEEILTARNDVGYIQGRVNIAVTGVRGAGKSTIVNCLRGVKHSDPAAAQVGETETTAHARPYSDEKHSHNVYHDLPGGGTENYTAWAYYYRQKLFAYDKILLVHTDTPTELDIKIIQICNQRNQECISVRSKADIHIYNCRRRKEHPNVEAARKDYVTQVEEDTIKLRFAASKIEGLRPKFTDYIVSEMGILQLVNEPQPRSLCEWIVDDAKLLQKLGLNGHSQSS